MRDYKVQFKEVLKRTVLIKANDTEEALDKAKEMYYKGEVVLDDTDFDGVVDIAPVTGSS